MLLTPLPPEDAQRFTFNNEMQYYKSYKQQNKCYVITVVMATGVRAIRIPFDIVAASSMFNMGGFVNPLRRASSDSEREKLVSII